MFRQYPIALLHLRHARKYIVTVMLRSLLSDTVARLSNFLIRRYRNGNMTWLHGFQLSVTGYSVCIAGNLK